MKKRVLTLLILSVAISVLLLSCSSQGPSSNASNSVAGFQGLTMELKVARTDFLISDSQKEFTLPFTLIVKNSGFYTVSKNGAVLQVSGYDPSLITSTKKNMNVQQIKEAMQGKSTTRPIGDMKVFSGSDFGLTFSNLDSITDSYDFDLFFNLCYKYATSFSSSIRLAPITDLNLANDVNIRNSISFSQGQGAPLAITGIDIYPSSKEVLLTIHVKQKSGRLIYYPDKFSTDECGSIDFSERNKFKVASATLSGVGGDCGNDKNNYFYLDDNGNGQIACKFELNNEITSPMTSILSLNLEYYVFDSLSQRFSIRKI